MDTTSIIRKMRALLAMSESTANEYEAMAAARQLHAMLAKHNMSVDVLSYEEDIGEEEYETTIRPWKRLLANHIAKLYFCKYYHVKYSSRNGSIVFVGSEANRTFALHIFKVIVKTIERQANKESRRLYGKENCGFVSSFWAAAKTRIVERCEELMEAAKEGTLEDEEGNTLPALLSTYESIQLALEDYADKNLDLTYKTSRTKVSNHAGATKGRETGNKVQLSRAIQCDVSLKMLSKQ